MISWSYVTDQMRAAWLYARRADAPDVALDATDQGLRRSFWAIGLALPVTVLIADMMPRITAEAIAEMGIEAPIPPGFWSYLQATMLILVAWPVALLILRQLSVSLKRQDAMIALLVSYNWTQLLIQLILCLGAIFAVMANSLNLYLLLYLATAGLSIHLRWGLLRRTLETDVLSTIFILIVLAFVAMAASSVVGFLVGQLVPEPTSTL